MAHETSAEGPSGPDGRRRSGRGRLALGLAAFANGAVSMGIMGAIAYGTRQPFVFPSLGPTAFLIFYRPDAEVASPRNSLLGHLVGAASGYLALLVFGLQDSPVDVIHGVSVPRIGAAALSLALTGAVMIWLNCVHAPAGATTLIVSLGLLHTLPQLGILLAGVAILVGYGLLANRLTGLP